MNNFNLSQYDKTTLGKIIDIENTYCITIYEKGTCCWSGCSNLAINSHTVSSSQQYHLLQNQIGFVNLIQPLLSTFKKYNTIKFINKSPIRKSLTFGGFCNEHEQIFYKIFQDIDHGSYLASENSLNTILYRFLCREIKKLNSAKEALNDKNYINFGLKLINPNNLTDIQIQQLINDLMTLKLYLENFIDKIQYITSLAPNPTLTINPNTRYISHIGLSNHLSKLHKIIHFGGNKKLPFIGTSHVNFFNTNIPNKFSIMIHVFYNTDHNDTEFIIYYPTNLKEGHIIQNLDRYEQRLFCLWHLIKTYGIVISTTITIVQENQIEQFMQLPITNNWKKELELTNQYLNFLL